MKQKLTKKQLKEIREFAATIPTTYYLAKQKVLKTAAQILEITEASPSILELQEEIKAKGIKPETKYILEYEVQMPVNHYNRLKHIAYQSGEKGCKQYIEDQMDLYTAPQPINLHSKVI